MLHDNRIAIHCSANLVFIQESKQSIILANVAICWSIRSRSIFSKCPPGTSEHNTGLAFDFIITNNKNSLKTNYDSDEYFYLENIAYLYGFIIRYPKDKEEITGYNYEPWHLRYVGQELAKYLKKNNLTLEEYYETGR